MPNLEGDQGFFYVSNPDLCDYQDKLQKGVLVSYLSVRERDGRLPGATYSTTFHTWAKPK